MTLRRLGELAEIVMGQAPPGTACNFSGKGMPFVKAGEFEERFPIVREWTTKPLRLARTGDVLVCVVGATAGKVNQAIDAAIGRSVSAVRPINDSLSTSYLFHFLGTQTLRLRGTSQGLAQGVITREMLRRLEIPLPSIAEQRRIAAILDQAEALGAKRRQALTKVNTLIQSLFLETFGSPFAECRPYKKEKLIDVVNGVFDCPHSTPTWTEIGVRCLRTPDIGVGQWVMGNERFVSENTYTERSRRGTLEPGDIVLSREGTVGIAAIVPEDMRACLGQRLVQIKPNSRKAIPEFLLWYLLQILEPEHISHVMVGSTAQHLNVKELRRIKVPLPPLPEQAHFAQAVKQIRELINWNLAGAEYFGSLSGGLEHRAFRGEL